MKIARLDDELITLHEHTYSHIPHWRIRAAQGHILCPACGEPVLLIAGISHEPFFQHRSLQSSCSGPDAGQLAEAEIAASTGQEMDEPVLQPAAMEADEEEVWEGKIRLPKNRSIAQKTAQAAPSSASLKPKRFRTLLTPKKRISVMEQTVHNRLHPEQERAVQTTEGPLLILAGAGSGKTRVMTARTAYLIDKANVDPRSIMVVTFTTKAAEEIKQRLMKQLSPEQARSVITGTFHSIFYRMLLHFDPVRWNHSRLLKQDWQKRKFIRESITLTHPQVEIPVLSESQWDDVLSVISRWKNDLLLPREAALLPPSSDEEKVAQELYPIYEEMKQRQQWFDFDDMLIGCYEMLTQNADVRRLYQERIAYLMIDEFQDINRVQYEIVKLLALPANNLCVIGDDDQSIYGFRGSNPEFILGFTKDYPQANTITLEVNYRSRASIVGLGYSLIGNNRTRWKKPCTSFQHDEGECFLFHPQDEEEQASRIADEISLRVNAGAAYHQFAVLFRTYESTRPVLERFTEAHIPFAMTREEEPFYRKLTVRWALGYLKLAVNPDDEQALREILPTLYVSASAWNEIRSQSILDDIAPLYVLPRLAQIKPFQRSHFQKVIEVLSQISESKPAQALELIYEDLRLREYVKKRSKERSEPDSEHATDDLRQLLTAAKRHPSIPDFLRYVDDMLKKEMESRNAPQPDDAVQIMSIHRAKGLEFNTVFVIDAVEGSLPHEYAIEQKRQANSAALEEERRLMYVAITRARHHLFIGVPQQRLGRKTRMSRFISEMGRE